ncbi:hypothetical protein ACU4IU_12575 [Brevibacterium sp. CSND-B09]|uniref:hypothetical protein n=1 Tax=Brevibacterium sp. CSND-B09 TaxID=3462571 RepID=UPI00406A215F
MPVVVPEAISLEEARRRYDAILGRIADLDDFRAKAEAYALDSEGQAIYDDLVELEFLIGK